MREENVTNIRCDGAGCPHSITIDAKGFPVGWYRIQFADEHGYGNRQFDFHSLKCIFRWAKERDKIKNGVPKVTSDMEAKILEIIGNPDEAYSANDIAELLEVHSTTARKYLEKMHDEKKLLMHGQGTKQDPYMYSRFPLLTSGS